MSVQEERRRTPRAAIVREVRYRQADAETHKRESKNIGPGGLFIRCPRPAAVGERIDLEGLLASLGVDRAGEAGFALDDSRPLAWVRHGIVGERIHAPEAEANAALVR